LANEGESFLVQTTPEPHKESHLFGSLTQKLKGRSSSAKGASPSPTTGDERRYNAEDIGLLETQGRAKRGEQSAPPQAQTISQVLRVLGDYMDHRRARGFAVTWVPNSVSVDYQTSDGQSERETFDVANLYDLAVHMYLRRANRAG
jgi:hypothetical protein